MEHTAEPSACTDYLIHDHLSYYYELDNSYVTKLQADVGASNEHAASSFLVRIAELHTCFILRRRGCFPEHVSSEIALDTNALALYFG